MTPAPDRGAAGGRRDGRREGRRGFLLVRVLVTMGVLGVLFVVLPWEEIRRAASRMTVPLYLGGLAGFVAAHAIGAVKWRIMMAASFGGTRLSPRDTAGCYGAGLFSNLFLPTVVGGDVVRAGLAARSLGRPEAVVLGSVADRLVDVLALGLLLGGGALVTGLEGQRSTGALMGLGAVAAMAVGLLVLPFLLRRPLAAWPRPIRRRVGRGMVALRHLGRRPGRAALALGLSTTMQGLLILIAAWLGHAVGARAPLSAWFLAWPLAKAAGMLPVSVGGLGVRDAALASLLVPFGVPAALGLVASLAWNAVLIGAALLGGALWWLLRPGGTGPSAAAPTGTGPSASTDTGPSTSTSTGTEPDDSSTGSTHSAGARGPG